MCYGIVSQTIAELALMIVGYVAASAGLWLMLCVDRSTIQSPVSMSRVPVSMVRPVDLFLITSTLASNIA